MLIKSCQHKETLPSFVQDRKCSRARRRKTPSEDGRSYPMDWSEASLLSPAVETAVNIILSSEPRSVLRGHFCEARLCSQWQEVRRWWAVLLYLTLSSRCATARGGREEERTIQCGEEARPNKTCHTSITENEQAHTESASKGLFWADFRRKSLISGSWEYYICTNNWKYHQTDPNIQHTHTKARNIKIFEGRVFEFWWNMWAQIPRGPGNEYYHLLFNITVSDTNHHMTNISPLQSIPNPEP